MGDVVKGGWSPGNDRQHAPFPPGNEVATRHGIYSPRKVDPLATSLVEALLEDEDVSYLRAASYRTSLWAWGRAEATVQLLVEYVEQAGGLGEALVDRGEETSEETHNGGHSRRVSSSVRTASVLTALDRAERHAQTCRARLGLDPLSRARLGRDVASAGADLVQLLTSARELHEQGDTA